MGKEVSCPVMPRSTNLRHGDHTVDQVARLLYVGTRRLWYEFDILLSKIV